MKVLVLGKENIKGISKKSGSEYNLNIVHITYVKNGVEGQACDTVVLDAVTYPLNGIEVSKTYDLDRDGKGYVIGFEIVK